VSEAQTPRRRCGETFVEWIYDSMLRALEQGQPLEAVLPRYIPMLLSELDAMTIIFPEMQDLLVDTVQRLWYKWFKDIPRPSIERDDSATTILTKIVAQLDEYRDRILPKDAAYMSSDEVRARIEYTAFSFMDTVCRRVFKQFGILR